MHIEVITHIPEGRPRPTCRHRVPELPFFAFAQEFLDLTIKEYPVSQTICCPGCMSEKEK